MLNNMEKLEKNSELNKAELAIEPLSPEEEAEFSNLIEKIQNEDKYSASEEYEWAIVDKFGERAVPYLIKESGGSSWKGDKIAMYRFLDTLVTEKTAQLVLEAMKDGKVDIHDGAIPASEGKGKTAEGLAEILLKLKLPNQSGRGYHSTLLEAISACGVDDVAPKIVEFYNKLTADKAYSVMVKSHKKSVGSDMYEFDAEDVVLVLAKLGGPISNKLLEDLANNGDDYIKKNAQNALEGKVYLGHPHKWLIKKPVKKEEIYDYESDDDLYDSDDQYDNSWSDYDDLDYQPNLYRKPEQLSPTVEISFLEKDSGLDEEKINILKDYFGGKAEVFETLGKLIGKSDVKTFEDLPEDKRGEGLAAATLFELYKIPGLLPDFKAAREALDRVKEQAGQDPKSEFYIKNIEDNLENIVQEDFRLPESAFGFKLWHDGLQKERNIKPFVELFRQKNEPFLYKNAFESIMGGTSSKRMPAQMVEKVRSSFQLYRDVTGFDVPLYEKSAKRLLEIAKDKTKVFYGRDTDYFYYAVKAMRFGMDEKKDLKKIYINTALKSRLRAADSAAKDRIMAYLLQEKVTADAIHIDTGFTGSVPEAVLQNLDPELKPEEISKKIKLLESHRHDRETMSAGQDVVIIENRPHAHGEITDIKRDEKTGRLKVVYDKPDAGAELRAWVVNQAIIRYFAPKKK